MCVHCEGGVWVHYVTAQLCLTGGHICLCNVPVRTVDWCPYI